jgi:twitching motility protein PilT
MEYHQSSQIPTLSYIENEDHPVFGTLVEQILHLLNSRLVFSDIIIHQNSPLMLRQPKGLVAVTDSPITKEELEEFFDVIEPNWAERIAVRAFDRSIDLHTARIRANCFSFQGKKRLGCVIRRFPKEPLALAELGLWQDEQEFARLASGLVLIIGDTCQGKSTTIASMIDEINKQRSGHIITIEDPVETLIPQRKCIITQREVGEDADVASYYLGALDALRERPDVIVIGEIRDAETAQEALALAESGPLVLATLHARSTELGLHPDEQEFARLTSGLVLIIGDTCQGKSTTIASILDEINRQRSGHIITIEDPVETLIPQRKCIITQREVGVDGDVDSYYLGALDALRERPDVIVIGEIRDAQTAQEALALAESGPLVLATLHARSTELGLQKMLRLLGNSDAQGQALAHALRGVLCQALLPSKQGNRYHLATECLSIGPAAAGMIEQGDLGAIRAHMNAGREPGCHTMNSVLEGLLASHKVSVDDARAATTDRIGFAEMV